METPRNRISRTKAGTSITIELPDGLGPSAERLLAQFDKLVVQAEIDKQANKISYGELEHPLDKRGEKAHNKTKRSN